VRTDVVPNQPFIFRSYNNIVGCDDVVINHCLKIPRSPFTGTCFALSWQAARATTAAVPYFKMMKVPIHSMTDIALDHEDDDDTPKDDYMSFIDGGVVHNDPSAVAYFEAKHLYGEDRPVILVSLGTGSLQATRQSVPYLISKLSTSLFGGLFDSKEASSRVMLRNILQEGKNYFRFNCNIKISDMTASECMHYWKKRGAKYAQKPSVNKKLRQVAKYCAKYKDSPLPIKKISSQ